jgi:acyl-CoA synthetase (AMP-forming)/AMP-acid ligase II
MMKEYYNDPGELHSSQPSHSAGTPFTEATRKALTLDGWYKSGDIGYMDAEGFVYIKDRGEHESYVKSFLVLSECS